MRCQIIESGQELAVLMQIDGNPDHAWFLTMKDFIQMVQNPPGIIIPQAVKQSKIELPPEQTIITN